MEERLNYRCMLTSYYPSVYAGREFSICLVHNNTEIGFISGYLYEEPNTYLGKTYGELLMEAEGMSVDEYVVLNAMIKELGKKLAEEEGLSPEIGANNIFQNDIFCPMVTIDRVYILPQHRNKGYAKEAMSKIEKIIEDLFSLEYSCPIGLIAHAFELAQNGSASLSLKDVSYSSVQNNGWLTKFYESAGFSKIEPEDGGADILVKM